MKVKTRSDFVDFWANYVRNNPIEVWKPQVRELIDSQIIMANRFYERLARTRGGKKKIEMLGKMGKQGI